MHSFHNDTETCPSSALVCFCMYNVTAVTFLESKVESNVLKSQHVAVNESCFLLSTAYCMMWVPPEKYQPHQEIWEVACPPPWASWHACWLLLPTRIWPPHLPHHELYTHIQLPPQPYADLLLAGTPPCPARCPLPYSRQPNITCNPRPWLDNPPFTSYEQLWCSTLTATSTMSIQPPAKISLCVAQNRQTQKRLLLAQKKQNQLHRDNMFAAVNSHK